MRKMISLVLLILAVGPLGAYANGPVNNNLVPQIVDGNWQTTAATTDVRTIAGVTEKSSCFVKPFDGSAAAAKFTAFNVWAVAAAGTVTVHHPATAAVHLNLYCSRVSTL
jgi:hypothetical protein